MAQQPIDPSVRRVDFAFAIALALTFTVGYFAVKNSNSIAVATQDRLESSQRRITLDRLLGWATDAETGQRGFLLTGNSQFLEPYLSATQVYKSDLDILRERLNTNTDQIKRLELLTYLFEERLDLLAQTIELQKNGMHEEAVNIVKAGRSKNLMDQIRGTIAEMRSAEEQIWTTKVEEASKTIHFGNQIAILFSFFGVALVLGAWVYSRQQFNAKKEAEIILSEFFGSSLDLLCVAGVDGYFKKLNPSWETVVGFTSDELCSKPIVDFIHPEDRKKSSNEIVNQKKGRKVLDFEHRFQCKDGSYKWLSWKSTMVGNKLYAAARDITEAKHLLSLQKKDSERLNSIIRLQSELAASGTNIDDLMSLVVQRAHHMTAAAGAVIEMVDGDEMVYRAASGAAAEKIGSRLKQATSLSGHAVSTNKVLICTDAETDPRVDWEACKAVGVRSMVVSPLHDKTNVIGVLKVYSSQTNAFSTAQIATLELISGFLANMIERATVSEALNKAEQAAVVASQMKSEFLANMSHEIRTPINGVMGMANILLDTHLDAEQKQYADNIARSADTLLVLVNDILDLSKAEAGKIELEIVEFELEQVVDDVEKTLNFAAKQKNISLQKNIQAGLPRRLKGDPTRLRQVLMNLVNNAIKFTEVGHVRISITAKIDSSNGCALLCKVEDTGIGIPASALGRMFQSFSQADASTTRRFGGTGLGLSISKQLVTLMGGEIGVNSVDGQGSEFWFSLTLPMGTAIEANPQNELFEIKLSPIKLRVLLAEDNSVNQVIAIKMLQKMGYSVVAVANGKEAIDAVLATPYDLVFMDCQMPEMDGYEATRTIRAHSQLEIKKLKIIAMTANAMSGDREKCLAAGMDDYVTKPVKAADIHAAISRVWAQKKAG